MNALTIHDHHFGGEVTRRLASAWVPGLVTEFCQNKLLWVDQNHANHFGFQIWVIGESFLQQIIHAADGLDPGESAARSHKGEQRYPIISCALGIRFLKPFDQ